MNSLSKIIDLNLWGIFLISSKINSQSTIEPQFSDLPYRFGLEIFSCLHQQHYNYLMHCQITTQEKDLISSHLKISINREAQEHPIIKSRITKTAKFDNKLRIYASDNQEFTNIYQQVNGLNQFEYYKLDQQHNVTENYLNYLQQYFQKIIANQQIIFNFDLDKFNWSQRYNKTSKQPQLVSLRRLLTQLRFLKKTKQDYRAIVFISDLRFLLEQSILSYWNLNDLIEDFSNLANFCLKNRVLIVINTAQQQFSLQGQSDRKYLLDINDPKILSLFTKHYSFNLENPQLTDPHIKCSRVIKDSLFEPSPAMDFIYNWQTQKFIIN